MKVAGAAIEPGPLLLLAALFAGVTAADGAGHQAELEGEPINRLQVLGTHNSYAMPIDPKLVALASPMVERMYSKAHAAQDRFTDDERALLAEEHPQRVDFADARAYEFPPLRQQLDDGMRSLELDIYNDPEGGAFTGPAGYRRLQMEGVTDTLPHDESHLGEPGLKVLHVPDLDFRTHCATFSACLEELALWSDNNPRHEPVFVLVELKTRAMPLFDEAAAVVPFDQSAFDELDETLIAAMGRGRVITPDDVRGDYETLNQAVLAGNWPTLAQSRGRFVFLVITAGDLSAHAPYLENASNLQGRAAFLRAQPGEDHAAFLMLDNALVREAEIRERVREGYLVRTRADIDTWEAQQNDWGRARSAFRSGAQVISTDFYQSGNRFGTEYRVSLPGTAPIRRSPAFERNHDDRDER
ncbi:Ca2+-dependent phosphoinositide-specific phospholipase C [Chromatocurvus halotolerans]|uniref:Calcium-dependent phosphoinositide phospholipase C n=1 Tax=Chromatocurvus halotolerans TaxID=1132028 RepID=A0A4R2KSD1_9GAMM|nr:Ca2+-dependent phosphoinositide-specific phospholipase C [Chromatocurvus halotolerans]TCO76654.1 calcium-dependent phosphoinositide phospholipase C [Chromatocurvus halotolerans]